MKSFEMAFESYPQLIMGLFIWQGLQIKETLNIVSISVSAASAIYGFGDILVGFIYIFHLHFDLVDWLLIQFATITIAQMTTQFK